MTTSADDPQSSPSRSVPARAAQPATVLGSLPNGMFRLRLTDDREVVAHAAQDLRMALVRLLPGDLVMVDVSPFDPNKARIKRLLESSPKPPHPTPPQKPQQREQS